MILFGSLARGTAQPASDLDLWVEGLPESSYLEAVSVTRAPITSTDVDVVRAGWARDRVRPRALSEGVVLHES